MQKRPEHWMVLLDFSYLIYQKLLTTLTQAFNPHRAGGGGVLRPPSGFSQISQNGGTQRRCFWHNLSYIVSALVAKILASGNQRLGHQVKLREKSNTPPCYID